jgi:class 3 adenylate cyclase
MRDEFFALIDRLPNAGEAERESLEAQIWERFGVERAVMALDMSHFSLTVRRSGILSYLGLIRRMQVVTKPIVDAHGGALVEFHADNLMAVFPDVQQAVDAGIAMNRAFELQVKPDGGQMIEVAIGIDFGRFLFVDGCRCFGDTVNTAFKLGEDLARAGEILLTPGARARLAKTFPHPFSEQQFSISGLELQTFNVQHRNPK